MALLQHHNAIVLNYSCGHAKDVLALVIDQLFLIYFAFSFAFLALLQAIPIFSVQMVDLRKFHRKFYIERSREFADLY